MNFEIFRLSLINEWRVRYPTPLAVGGQIFSEICILTVYWFISKAYNPNFLGSQNFFSFILVGELALALPNFFFVNFSRILKQFVQEGLWENILVSRSKTWLVLLKHLMAAAVLEVLRMILVFLLLIAFFHMKSFAAAGPIFLAELLALPLFASLGLFSAAFVLLTGRGERALSLASSGLVVLAGVYFPTTVLPEFVHQAASLLSPFNILLDAIRGFLLGSENQLASFQPLFALFLSGVFAFPLAILSFEAAIRAYRRRHWPLQSRIQ